MLCCNSWQLDLWVLAQVDNYTKESVAETVFLEGYQSTFLGSTHLSYMIRLFKRDHLYPLNPPPFFNIHPPLIPTATYPPISPHVTADSHAPTPQAIHQLHNIVLASQHAARTHLCRSAPGKTSFSSLSWKPNKAKQTHIHLISISWWFFFPLQGSLERCTVVFWRCRGGKRWRWLSRPWSRATRRSRGRTFWARPPSWDSFPTRTLFDWRGWSPNVRISVSFAFFDTYFYKFLSISGQFGQVFSFFFVCS